MKIWLEITSVNGRKNHIEEFSFGNALWSPTGGRYKNMEEVLIDDVVIHYNKDSELIEGVSRIASITEYDKKCLGGTNWDKDNGNTPAYFVRLKDYIKFDQPFRLYPDILENQKYIPKLKDIGSRTKNLFYNTNLYIQQGRYLTRLPEELVSIFNDSYKHITNENLPYFSIPDTIEAPIIPSETNLLEYSANKNTILYGPPGTGKTYNTKKEAVKRIRGTKNGEI